MGGAGGFATKNAKKKKELTADERTQIGVGEGLAAKRREELKTNVNAERPTSNAEIRTGGGRLERWDGGRQDWGGGAGRFSFNVSQIQNRFRKYDNPINRSGRPLKTSLGLRKFKRKQKWKVRFRASIFCKCFDFRQQPHV